MASLRWRELRGYRDVAEVSAADPYLVSVVSEVGQLEARGVEVLVATGAQGGRRRHDFRPQPPHKPAKEPRADWLQTMVKKMELAQNQTHYRLRQQTLEPVFGIVKQAMGFRQFGLRGLQKVKGEWTPVMLAYNCRRLHNLRLA